MKIKKARVFAQTQGLALSFDQVKFKPSKIIRQYLCSFCLRELPNNSTRFNGIGACPLHFALAHKLVDGLRDHRREYAKRFEVKR